MPEQPVEGAALSIPSSISSQAEIPCGHCGQTVLVAIAELTPTMGVHCPTCTQQIPIYIEGLLDDVRAASEILAHLRRRLLEG